MDNDATNLWLNLQRLFLLFPSSVEILQLPTRSVYEWFEWQLASKHLFAVATTPTMMIDAAKISNEEISEKLMHAQAVDTRFSFRAWV